MPFFVGPAMSTLAPVCSCLHRYAALPSWRNFFTMCFFTRTSQHSLSPACSLENWFEELDGYDDDGLHYNVASELMISAGQVCIHFYSYKCFYFPQLIYISLCDFLPKKGRVLLAFAGMAFLPVWLLQGRSKITGYTVNKRLPLPYA